MSRFLHCDGNEALSGLLHELSIDIENVSMERTDISTLSYNKKVVFRERLPRGNLGISGVSVLRGCGDDPLLSAFYQESQHGVRGTAWILALGGKIAAQWTATGLVNFVWKYGEARSSVDKQGRAVAICLQADEKKRNERDRASDQHHSSNSMNKRTMPAT